jgi:flagellar biosynthetic protein FliR
MSLQLSTATLVALLLASVRAAAWLVVCPPFSSRAIPGVVKGLLAVAIALPMVPGLTGQLPAATPGGLLVSGIEQVVVGAALGFLTSVLFAAVQAAGDLIDLFGGFSVAFAFDPLSFTGNSVFGRFYNVLATTLLFVTNAHELVLRGFLQSYRTLPLDQSLSLAALDRALTTGIGQLFLSALMIAGPLIGVLFCADVGLGLLSRVAPALNAFSLGFPAKILLTLSLAGLGLLILPGSVSGLVEQAVRAVVGVAGS